MTNKLQEALQKLEELRRKHEEAKSNFLHEIERDAQREGGSDAQEARREERQSQLREEERYALAAYQKQLNIVEELRTQPQSN